MYFQAKLYKSFVTFKMAYSVEPFYNISMHGFMVTV